MPLPPRVMITRLPLPTCERIVVTRASSKIEGINKVRVNYDTRGNRPRHSSADAKLTEFAQELRFTAGCFVLLHFLCQGDLIDSVAAKTGLKKKDVDAVR